MAKLPDASDLGARPTPVSNRQLSIVRNPGAAGEAVAEVGRVAVQAGRELAELDQRRQAAQAGVEFARMAGEIATTANDRRSRAAPGAAGHVQTITGEIDRRLGGFLASIRDPEIRERFEVNAEQLRSRIIADEDGWEIGQRRDLAISNVDETTRLTANRQQTRPDANALQGDLDLIRSTIYGQEGLSADLAEKAIREGQSVVVRGYLRGLTEQSPERAREVLRSGVLNQWLGTDDLAALTDSVDSEVRAREAEARRELSQARQTARAEIDIVMRRHRDHDPTLTDADLERAQQLAGTAQLQSDAYDLAKARIESRVDREFRTATEGELGAALREMNARIARGGENANPDDVVRRDRMLSLQTARRQATSSDPLTGYSQRGGQVAPVNFGDANSVRARVTASRAAERDVGFFAFFTPEEARQMQERISSGPGGRLEAINEIASIARFDPQAALRAADQVAPNDAAFRRSISLPTDIRSLVVRGAEARRTMPTRIEMDDGTTTTFDVRSQDLFAAHIQPSLSGLPPQLGTDTLEAARNIYAELLRQRGELSSPEFNQTEFFRAVNLALGQTSSGGGTAFWRYGPRGPDGGPQGFLLPSGMRQGEFERRMANLPTRGAEWPAGSVNGPPVAAGGGRLTVDMIRSQFVPVAVRDGVYQFRRGSQVLTTPTGPFELNIRRLPPREAAQNAAPAQPVRRSPTRMQPALPATPANLPRGPTYRAPQ